MSTPRILIIRTSALGDIVQALPVLTALRRNFPSATIGWVVEDAFAPLLEGHPDVDELLTVQLRAWRLDTRSPSNWKAAATFFRRLHDFSADIVLDLMGNHKAGVIGALTMSDRRLGHSHEYRREPSSSIWLSEKVAARGEHAVDRMLSVLDGLAVPDEPADFGAGGLRETDPGLTPSDDQFVLLHPATGWGNKDYPAEHWASVASRLSDAGATVLVAPGPGEEPLAAKIAAASESAIRSLPPTTLPGLVFLQRRAALVLGGDTGPVHLAHALGTPVLSVMGPTDPERHGPYNSPANAIWVRLPCSFCHKRLDTARACLLEIDPRTVTERALSILGSGLH